MARRQVRWQQRWRYRRDELMSAGATAQIVALGLLTVLVILVMSGLVVLLDLDEKTPPLTVLYHALLETLDPGTVANFDGVHWWYAFLSVLLTFYGIFVVGALIGILSNAIDQRLQNLRKGRSVVVEHDHLVVLGWSSEVFTILEQVCISNANLLSAAAVILAPRDKVEMEDALRTKLRHTGPTRIVCRTGDPLDIDDLAIVDLENCRAIVILTPDDEPDPDALVIKTLLAVENASLSREAAHHIVVEIRERDNLTVARLVDPDVLFLHTTDLAAKVIAQACRQPGLSTVLTDLLNYQGSEIYLARLPELAGTTFAAAVPRLDTSSLIGVLEPDGTVVLNPPKDRVLTPEDRAIVISQDDASIVLDGSGTAEVCTQRPRDAVELRSERILVLGHNDELDGLIQHVLRHSPDGSEVVVAWRGATGGTEVQTATDGTVLRVTHIPCNPTSRADLERLAIATFDHIVILTARNVEAEHADAATLVTLLHVRDIETRAGVDINVVSEMRVERNKTLAEASTDDDFIVSSQLMSLFIAQVVMIPELLVVLEALLTDERAQLCLRPVGVYAQPGTSLTFTELATAALERDEVAIGYRLVRPGTDGTIRRMVVMNPCRSTRISFHPTDQLIVLSPHPASHRGDAGGDHAMIEGERSAG